MTFKDVIDWLEKSGKHQGPIQFYQMWLPTSPLYMHVSKTLLSMRTSGSMDVERVAKPLKNFLATKSRNRLKQKKMEMLLRVGMNLNLLYAARKDFFKNAYAPPKSSSASSSSSAAAADVVTMDSDEELDGEAMDIADAGGNGDDEEEGGDY